MPRDIAAEIRKSTEARHREFKRSATWDTLKWKITRTAMAMANSRDGGLIVIGVEKQGETHVPNGMSDEHISTYQDDQIIAFINGRADPYVSCTVHRVSTDDKQFIVIEIQPFDTLPIVCKKSGDGGLQEGHIYVRSFQMAETCVVQSQSEMRAMLDVAIDRGVRAFLARAGHAGVNLRVDLSDSERFDEEYREFIARVQTSRTLSKGHYEFRIRPIEYRPQRLPSRPEILSIVRRCEVRHYGWHFPFLYRKEEVVEQRSAGSPAHVDTIGEFWRMFQSGQFLYAVPYREDSVGQPAVEYMDTTARQIAPLGFVPTGVVNYHTLVVQCTQAYEFAARLASQGAIDGRIDVSIALTGTTDRVLVSTEVRAPFRDFWRASIPRIESRRTIDSTQLVANPKHEAAVAILEVTEPFGASRVG